MLKQPLSGFLHGMYPGYAAQRSPRFSTGSSSLFPNGFDLYTEVVVTGESDDSSVSSMESVTCEEKLDLVNPSSKPLTATVSPGSVHEMDSPPNKIQIHQVYMQQPKNVPACCYVNAAPSATKSRRRTSSAEKRFSLEANASRQELHASFNSAIPDDDIESSTSTTYPPNLPYAFAVATPISATKVLPCCDQCEQKDCDIKRQRDEIDQLKGLVTQLVNVLAQQQQQQQQQAAFTKPHAKDTLEIAAQDINEKAQAEKKVYSFNAPVQESAHLLEDRRSTSRVSGSEACSSQHDVKSASALTEPAGPQPSIAGSHGPRSTMLRLCRLKQLKEASARDAMKKLSHCRTGGKRHFYVSVGGEWGYYSGPPLEPNQVLHGCVVRFDSGDLYLGDMICYVPTTSFFNDEHGLMFHGRGSLYCRNGSIRRGLFHKHQLIE